MKPVRKYHIRLSDEQRVELERLVGNGVSKAKKITHARILLMRDENHVEGRWKDKDIVAALGVHRNQIGRVCKRFVMEGERPALERRVRQTPPNQPRLDGEGEAELIAICCSQAPEGRSRWSLSLLVDALKQRSVVATISRETVRKALKKTGFNLGDTSATASRRET